MGDSLIDGLVCRLAEPADIPVLVQMRWDFRMEDQPGSSQHTLADFVAACTTFFENGLATGEWAIWVAENEGQIVSNMHVRIIDKVPKPSALHDRFGYLTNVYTRPENRGQGVGRVLLAQVQAWAQEQDLEMLVVWPSAPSEAFYHRAGFLAGESLEYAVRPYID